MARPFKTTTIRGKKYRLALDEVIEGYCETEDPPLSGGKKKIPVLYVAANLPKRKTLQHHCHEFTHGWFPRKREDTVREFADALGAYLWRVGYRRR